jgi:hypothetical protein
MNAPSLFPIKKVRPRDANAEARIQAAIFEFVRTIAPDVLIYAVPNGGLRSKSEAARMKWTGVVAGIPDLALVLPDGRAAFVEVKAAHGALSEAQREIRLVMIQRGIPVITARSVDDVRAALKQWHVETREVAR